MKKSFAVVTKIFSHYNFFFGRDGVEEENNSQIVSQKRKIDVAEKLSRSQVNNSVAINNIEDSLHNKLSNTHMKRNIFSLIIIFCVHVTFHEDYLLPLVLKNH